MAVGNSTLIVLLFVKHTHTEQRHIPRHIAIAFLIEKEKREKV